MLQRTILNQCFWSPRSAWPGGCRPAVASVCLKAAKPTSEMGDPQYGRWLLRRWRETTSLTSGPTELTIGFSTTSASPEGTASGSSILRLQHGCQIWPGRAIAREPLVRERHRFQSRCRANRIRVCGQGYEVNSNPFPEGKRAAAHPMGREYVQERSFCKLRRASSSETMIRDSGPGRLLFPTYFLPSRRSVNFPSSRFIDHIPIVPASPECLSQITAFCAFVAPA